MRGYVYVLTNPSMPGLVKVGLTTRTVAGRAAELQQTGVPTPFAEAFSALSPDCVELERWVHENLADVRVAPDREFFRCEPNKVINLIEAGLREQVASFVSEYLEGHTLCEDTMVVDPGDIALICSETDDVEWYEFAQAVRFIDPAAIQAAVKKDRARARKAREQRVQLQLVAHG